MADQKKDEKPKRPAVLDSGFEASPRRSLDEEISQVGRNPRRVSSPSLPSVSRAPPAPAAPPKPKVPGGKPAPAAAKGLTAFQKNTENSQFDDSAHARRVNQVLGKTGQKDATSAKSSSQRFDGLKPAAQVDTADAWKAVEPPVRSEEGKRAPGIYKNVINQFAVGHNARYALTTGGCRGHIFVWDVSRAMGCEVPHWVGTKELSLGQTVDWLRMEGPMHKWMRGGMEEALKCSQTGMLVIAIPKEVKNRHMAIVRPDVYPDRRPRLAGAAMKRGNELLLNDLFGTTLVDFFIHA